MEDERSKIIKEIVEEIEENKIYDMDSMFKRREEIKEWYKELSVGEKQIYKWYYFGTLSVMRYRIKEEMWNYINGVENIESKGALISAYIEYKQSKRRMMKN